MQRASRSRFATLQTAPRLRENHNNCYSTASCPNGVTSQVDQLLTYEGRVGGSLIQDFIPPSLSIPKHCSGRGGGSRRSPWAAADPFDMNLVGTARENFDPTAESKDVWPVGPSDPKNQGTGDACSYG